MNRLHTHRNRDREIDKWIDILSRIRGHNSVIVSIEMSHIQHLRIAHILCMAHYQFEMDTQDTHSQIQTQTETQTQTSTFWTSAETKITFNIQK